MEEQASGAVEEGAAGSAPARPAGGRGTAPPSAARLESGRGAAVPPNPVLRSKKSLAGVGEMDSDDAQR